MRRRDFISTLGALSTATLAAGCAGPGGGDGAETGTGAGTTGAGDGASTTAAGDGGTTAAGDGTGTGVAEGTNEGPEATGTQSGVESQPVGSSEFLFDGQFVNIDAEGQVTGVDDGQNLGTVSVQQNDQNQDGSFQNVRVTSAGLVLNRQGGVVGRVDPQQGGQSDGGTSTGTGS